MHFFWENPVEEFKKLLSLLKSNGQIVMVFQPRWAKNEMKLFKSQNTEKAV